MTHLSRAIVVGDRKMDFEQLELRRMLAADVEIRFSYRSFFDGSSAVGQAAFAQPIGDVNGDGFDDLVASFSTDGALSPKLAVIFGQEGESLLEFSYVNPSRFPIESDRCCGEDFITSAYPIGDVNRDGFDDFNFVVFLLSDSEPRDFTIFGSSDFDLGNQLDGLHDGQLPLSPSTTVVQPSFDFNGDGVEDSLLDAKAVDIAFGEAASPSLAGYVSPDGSIVLEGVGVDALGVEFSSRSGLLEVPTTSAPFELILPSSNERVAIGSLGNAVNLSNATTLPIRYVGSDPQSDLTGRWGRASGETLAIELSFECGQGRHAGDINGDGEIGFADFTILSRNFGQTQRTYADGDLNCDGQITFADFLALAQNWGSA